MDNGPPVGCSEPMGDNDSVGELTKLRTRLREQTQLIAMLMEKAQQSTSTNLGAESRDEGYLAEKSRADALECRFKELADKFQELTVIKDECKEQNRTLELSLQRRAEETQAAVRPVLEAKDNQIVVLKKHVATLEREKTELLAGFSLKDYEKEMQLADLVSKNEQLKMQLADLVSGLVSTNEEQKRKLDEKTTDFEDLLIIRQELEVSVQELQAEVKRERQKNAADGSDQLQELVVERGDMLVRKDKTIQALEEEIEEWRKRVAESVGKLHDRSAAVDVDARVDQLNFKIVKLRKEIDSVNQQNHALRSVTAKELWLERERSSSLRNAKSISEIVTLQNKISLNGI